MVSGYDFTTNRSTPRATRIVWGTTGGFLIVSVIVASVLVRWRRKRDYHRIPRDALVEESLTPLGNPEDTDSILDIDISRIHSTSHSLRTSGSVYTNCDEAIIMDSPGATLASDPPQLSNAFSDIPDHPDEFSSSRWNFNSPKSWISDTASSYSTQIMSGAWKTSLQPAILSKPIYHTFQRPKAYSNIARDGFPGLKEITSRKAELINPRLLSLYLPEERSKHTSTLTNLSFPPSSPLEPPHRNMSRMSSDIAEEVAFYSAAKLQPLDDHDLAIARVLPLRPLPPLPPHTRPLPKPPQNRDSLRTLG